MYQGITINNSIKKKFVLLLSAVIIVCVTIVITLSFQGAKKELEAGEQEHLRILSESVYQSMTNMMLSGNADYVRDAEKNAKSLEGVSFLNIAKSKRIINDFNLKTPFTTDKEIQKVFHDKKIKMYRTDDGTNQLKILKPFIAQKRCLNCHVGAKEGDVLGVMDLRVSLDKSDSNIAFFTTMMASSNVLLAIILLVMVFFLLDKLVSKPLHNMIAVIKELSLGNRDLTKRLHVKTDDELGVMAGEFNKYLQTIEDTHKEERLFISDARKTIQRVKRGWYSDVITAKTSSETLNAFKNDVNDMLLATKGNFEHINSVLIEYTKHNYTKELKLENIDQKGVFARLVKHINELKTVITNMLIESKKSSLTLDKSSDVLLGNVETLNNTAMQTESYLEDVNRALQSITDNISINGKNVMKMSNLSQEVTTSANEGEKLAIQTVSAMNEINTHISDIDEAIGVIDQIAFQTNILSLNAAVEAATAGEAGKGFSVVASEVRKLAAKSAEAAHQIKELVEVASLKSIGGKEVANQMIEGYHTLNSNISNTVHYIDEIRLASKEQLEAIDQINANVTKVTQQIKENAHVTQQTKNVALQTDKMAKYAVSIINKKEFIDTVNN